MVHPMLTGALEAAPKLVGFVREPRAEAAGLKKQSVSGVAVPVKPDAEAIGLRKLSPFGATAPARRASSFQRGRFSAALSAPAIDFTNFGTVSQAL
ncbi:MAG: hypothetical protein ACOX87_11650 [Chloroflexota bacterium]|jgi:hypothetical protein